MSNLFEARWCHLGWDPFGSAGHSRKSHQRPREPYGWVYSGIVSHLAIYGTRALTTPWPPPQRGGELVSWLPSLGKEGVGGGCSKESAGTAHEHGAGKSP